METPASPVSGYSGKSSEQDPFNKLNALILSMDWEITDSVIREFTGEVKRLGRVYRSDKVIPYFLKILGTLGNYIASFKAGAHPDSMTLIHSSFSGLQAAGPYSDLTLIEKKRIFLLEADKFRKFKSLMAEHNGSAHALESTSGKSSTSQAAGKSSGVKIPDFENLKSYIDEAVKKAVQEEIADLRKEMISLIQRNCRE